MSSAAESPVHFHSPFSNSMDYFSPTAYTLDLCSSSSPPSPTPRSRSSCQYDDTPSRPGRMLRFDSSSERAVVVLASPGEGSRAARRSVQLDEKATVNWARPLRLEGENAPVCIFGASLQRTRRLKRQSQTSMTSPLPSPASSSDDEPQTPSPILASESPIIARRGWSMMSDHYGLGVGEQGWDEAPGYFVDSKAQATAVVETPSKLLASSQSMSDFASPATLDELRYLRQAAVDLAEHVRKPVFAPLRSTSTRRIRRKAVPSIDIGEISHFTLPSPLDPSSMRHHRSRTLDPNPPILPPRSTELHQGQRPRYQTHSSSRSVIEVSPRVSSLPSRQAWLESVSVPDGLTQMATTPRSLQGGHADPDTFLRQMDSGLKKLELEGRGKHRRGLSGFLGRRQNEV
ncbi:hypothetical protein BCR39DRAFT_34788 [Naematelia encephala]|uniref:Uncharacterized protein n=1 Tax=Naematelia encephala TaxID=71784 RepID=A0A1Y2BM19_9TREE|nr:hypothetical protein BCR39DRAFT_34788 [Naematelia encephala]